MGNTAFKKALTISISENLKIDELINVGSKIYYQTHVLPLIKLNGNATEVYLIFKTNDAIALPILLNAVLEPQGKGYLIHFSGMQISQRNNFEKELIIAKNEAETALREDLELNRITLELDKCARTVELQLQQINTLTVQQQQIDKVLSHDLQEPLRKITFFASMIEPGGKNTRVHVARISEAAQHLRNLLSRLQRLQDLEYRNFVLAPVNLKQLIENASKRIDQEVSINTNLAHDVQFIGDAEQLTVIFEELLVNSFKFAHSERLIEVKISSSEVVKNTFIETENKYSYKRYSRIPFSDNGSGFDSDYTTSVFKIFNKLHKNDGLGIGLTYVKRVIEKHNGSVTVSSKSDAGTTFIILIPVEND